MNNEIDNSFKFFKFWRNIIIRKHIFLNLKISNNHYYIESVIDSNSFLPSTTKNDNDGLILYNNYRYKYYLRSITILINNEKDNQENSDVIQFIKELPSNIEKLTIVFKSTLKNCGPLDLYSIPSHIKELSIHFPQEYRFNISNKSFSSIQELKSLELLFDSKVIIKKGSLPNSLVNLKLSGHFELSSSNSVLPSSIKRLDIYTYTPFIIAYDSLPNLENLKTMPNNYQMPPRGLKSLHIYGSVDRLKSSDFLVDSELETLILERTNSENTMNESSFPINSSIKTIKIGSGYVQNFWNNNISFMPASVTKLVTCSPFCKSVSRGCLPIGLVKLKTPSTNGNLCNSSIPPQLSLFYGINSIRELRLLPNHVKTVGFDLKFDTPLEPQDIPYHITSLTFGHCFMESHPLRANTFQSNDSLKFIKFDISPSCYAPVRKQSFEVNSLPSNLKYLEFNPACVLHERAFRFENILPSNLTVLVLPSSFKLDGNIALPSSLLALKFTVQRDQRFILKESDINPFDNININYQLHPQDNSTNVLKIPQSITILSISNANDPQPFNVAPLLTKSLRKLIINHKSLLVGLEPSTLSPLPIKLDSIIIDYQFSSLLPLCNLDPKIHSLLSINNQTNDLKLFKKIINFKK